MGYWELRIQEINKKYDTAFKNREEVKDFLKKHGLLVDGKIGKNTEKKIQELRLKHPSSDRPEKTYRGKLREIVVTAKNPKKSTIERVWDDFTENDPIFGKRRQRLVAKHYGPNNPFRQGNDIVANAITDAALTTATGAGLWNIGKYIAKEGFRAIPAVIAALGGAYGGEQAFETAVEGATGKTWDEHMTNAGIDPYGRALFAPGGWAGSYGAGVITNAVVNNINPWFTNSVPRTVMTTEGPVTLLPGESITINGRPVGYQNGAQGASVYLGTYTTKSGSGRGSAAGQKGRVQTSLGNKNLRVPGRVLPRVMHEVTTVRGSSPNTYTAEMVPFPTYTPWNGWIGFLYTPPVEFPIEVPPVTPPVAPPVEPPVQDYRLEEFRPYEDPFLIWYAKQPEGTTLYYSGDNIHRPGPYIIHRINPDPKSTTRLVGDNLGFIIPDSTTVNYGVYQEPSVTILPGGVPDEAIRSNEKITGY